MLKVPQCMRCIHYRWGSGGDALTCEAFPTGIPADIARNIVRHDAPYPGDNGLLFEEDPHWAGDGDDDFTPTGPAFEED